MRRREGWVKRLDAECAGVFVEPLRRHQRDGPETTNVAVVQIATVVERQMQRGVAALRDSGRGPRDQQQRARESRLDDDAVAGREIEHDELGAPPARLDGDP